MFSAGRGASFTYSSCLFPLLKQVSLLVVPEHVEQRLQQPVVSVSVRLGSVEVVAVVIEQAVLGGPVAIQQVQGLVQLLWRDVLLLEALLGSRRHLPVKG